MTLGLVYPVQGPQLVVVLSELAVHVWLPAAHMLGGRHALVVVAGHSQ
jgi:hypothetical protein